jgi:hypothetical protein
LGVNVNIELELRLVDLTPSSELALALEAAFELENCISTLFAVLRFAWAVFERDRH